jgi:hypothetical protein
MPSRRLLLLFSTDSLAPKLLPSGMGRRAGEKGMGGFDRAVELSRDCVEPTVWSSPSGLISPESTLATPALGSRGGKRGDIGADAGQGD